MNRFHLRQTLLTAVLLNALAVTTTVAQTPATPQNAPALRTTPASRSTPRAWHGSGTGTLRFQPPSGSISPPNDPNRRRTEKNARYGELQRALKSLLDDWEQVAASAPPVSQPPVSPPAEQQTPPSDLQLPDPAGNAAAGTTSQEPPTAEPETTIGPPEPVAADTAPETEPAETAADNEQQDPEQPHTEEQLRLLGEGEGTLVDGPVDRVALADNLYRMGEFTLAQEMYSRVRMEQQTADQQFWVQFQIASCLRRRGDLAAAKKRLRVLAGQEEAGWLAKTSHWWLDAIDDRTELEQQLAETRRVLDSHKDRRHASK